MPTEDGKMNETTMELLERMAVALEQQNGIPI